jgi:hypothetical protein
MKSTKQLKREALNAEIEVIAFQIVCQKIEAASQPNLKDALSLMQVQLGKWQAKLLRSRKTIKARAKK